MPSSRRVSTSTLFAQFIHAGGRNDLSANPALRKNIPQNLVRHLTFAFWIFANEMIVSVLQRYSGTKLSPGTGCGYP